MKKMILAIAAIGAFATVNAQTVVVGSGGLPQSVSGNTGAQHITDNVTLKAQFDDAIAITPEYQSLTSALFNYADLSGGANYLSIGSSDYSVWSNEAWGATVNGEMGATMAWTAWGSEAQSNDISMPISNIRYWVSNAGNLSGANNGANNGTWAADHTAGYSVQHSHTDLATSPAPAVTHASPGSSRSFTMNYEIKNPQTFYAGGTYNTMVGVTFTQE